MNYQFPAKRPKPVKSIYKERSVPAFRRFVKARYCTVKGCQCPDIDPAHIRYGLPPDAPKGGVSLKPSDAFIIPLCRDHHNEQHQHGEQTFYAKYKIDALTVAEGLWNEWLKTTEPGQRWRRENGQS